MNKQFAIFDMDGTLVDSMRFWRRLGEEYLHTKGVSAVSAEILEKVKPMTMAESAALFTETYGLQGTPETVVSEMNALMDRHYREDIPLRAGAREYLRRLRDSGIRLCLASAAEETLASECLRRLGIYDCFEFLLSCETIGIGKERPDIYLLAAERFGAAPGDVAVYEDALYAARTAKAAGFYLVAVYEESGSYRWEKVKALADEYIEDWVCA